MHLLKVGDIHTVQQLKNVYKLTQNNQRISTRFWYGDSTIYMNTLLETDIYDCYWKSSPQIRRKVHKIFCIQNRKWHTNTNYR